MSEYNPWQPIISDPEEKVNMLRSMSVQEEPAKLGMIDSAIQSVKSMFS